MKVIINKPDFYLKDADFITGKSFATAEDVKVLSNDTPTARKSAASLNIKKVVSKENRNVNNNNREPTSPAESRGNNNHKKLVDFKGMATHLEGFKNPIQ